jgi:predicted RNA-binding protein with RPS1 domain
VIRCMVARVMDFGAFVELPEGVQGLIPKNELGYTHTPVPQEAVKVGETVLAIMLSLDEEGGRMALSMRQVPREKQIEWLLAAEDTGREKAAGESAPQEGAPQEDVPEEGAPEEVAPQEGAPQEGAPQEGAAPEGQLREPDQTGRQEPPLHEPLQQTENGTEASLASPLLLQPENDASEDAEAQPDEMDVTGNTTEPPMAPPKKLDKPDEDNEPPMAPPENSHNQE